MKNGSEPISIYSFSRRIRIRIQNWTKTGPKPDFDQFSKNYVFLSATVRLHVAYVGSGYYPLSWTPLRF